MSDFMKTPCKHCPFRNDVTPYLHPERASDIAGVAYNPYSTFPCHKTTEYDEEYEDMLPVETSKECAGMLTLRANELGEDSLPEGFEPAYDICYVDVYDMEQAYEEEWNKNRKVN